MLAFVLVGGLIVARTGGGDVPTSDGHSVAVDAEQAPVQLPPAPSVAEPEHVAAAAVAMTGEVARAGFISRRELIESFTTPGFGPVLADDTSEQMTALLLEFSERDADPAELQVTEQPLRTRVVTEDAAAATVDVWSVLVVAPPGASTARVMWRTVTVELLLIDGLWLVDGWTSTPGPTPMVGPESPISPAIDVAEVLAWSPAVADGV
ncbi:MAG TPA: hypothetical protein VMM60_16945 [Ilumatobacter sp.]|nr:hypothetical protein [Ilumatobacter sp.]